MRIMWVVNHLMSQITNELGIESPTSGSWLVKLSDEISKREDIELSIICPFNQNIELVINNIRFYLVKTNCVDKFVKPTYSYNKNIEKIIKKEKPDLIHIHGTEFAFNNAFFEMGIPVVTSIQGLISEIIKNGNDMALINKKPYLKYGRNNLIKVYSGELIKRCRNKFRARSEIDILKKSDNIIGRTNWDRAHSYFINSNANYYFIQETIRNEFFKSEWDSNNFKKYSILCAGGYSNPLKGAHIILESVALIKKEFPEIKIRIVGTDLFNKKSKTGYDKLLLKIIDKLNLYDQIEFTGKLNAEKMAFELSKANVYVMASSMENSSNTLAEAMCIGTPTILPFVGGNSSLSSDGVESLYYRFGDVEHLAWKIKTLFEDNVITNQLSKNSKKRSAKQYSNESNIQAMIDIYKKIDQNYNNRRKDERFN